MTKESDHSFALWRVLKELKTMKETVFEMSNEESSFQFDDILNQSATR
jgi:hypothetical protein